MGTADAIASLLAITKLRGKLRQNSSQSHAKQQNLKLHVRLGQCYVKLHHGTVLGMLSLLLLAGLKFALQNSPTVQFGTALSKSSPRLHY